MLAHRRRKKGNIMVTVATVLLPVPKSRVLRQPERNVRVAEESVGRRATM